MASSELAMVMLDDDDTQSVDTESCVSESTVQEQDLEDDEDNLSNFSTPVICSSSIVAGRVTKTKKRVSFPGSEDLVRIREIPPREESPLSEELMPCDPSRLVDNLSSLRLGAFASRRLDIAAQLTALQPTVSSFNILSKEVNRHSTRSFIGKKAESGVVAAARATTDSGTLRRQKVPVIKNITAPDDIGETLRIDDTSERQNERKLGKRHVASTRLSTHHHKKAEKHDKTTGKKSKHIAIGGKDTTGHSKNVGKHKSKRHIPSPSTSASNGRSGHQQGTRSTHSPHPPVAIRLAHSRTDSADNGKRLKQVIDINTKTLNSGEQLFNAEVGLFTNPRVHSSPYRAASAGQLRGRHVTSTSDLHKDFMDARSYNLRSETGKMASGTIQSKRLYAWQMANGIAIQNPQLETPCIAPMWELPRSNSTIDSLPLT